MIGWLVEWFSAWLAGWLDLLRGPTAKTSSDEVEEARASAQFSNAISASSRCLDVTSIVGPKKDCRGCPQLIVRNIVRNVVRNIVRNLICCEKTISMRLQSKKTIVYNSFLLVL